VAAEESAYNELPKLAAAPLQDDIPLRQTVHVLDMAAANSLKQPYLLGFILPLCFRHELRNDSRGNLIQGNIWCIKIARNVTMGATIEFDNHLLIICFAFRGGHSGNGRER